MHANFNSYLSFASWTIFNKQIKEKILRRWKQKKKVSKQIFCEQLDIKK